MAREKHVFKTDEIPHLWANKRQGDARNQQGNLYFKGDTIYSYGSHFPIACHVTNEAGENAVLLTTETYSPTTARHFQQVRHSIRNGTTIFHVPLRSRWGIFGKEEHIESYRERVKEALAKASKARRRKSEHLSNAFWLVTQANQYAVFFGLPPVFDSENGSFDLEKYQAEIAEARRIERAAEKARELKAIADATEKIERWLAGEHVSLPYLSQIYLRVEDTEVVSSRGARFPIEHAVKGLRLIDSCRALGRPYQRNEKSIHLGHYVIDSIDKEGNVHAGCHYIEYYDIQRIRPALEAYALKKPVDSADSLQSLSDSVGAAS